MRNSAPAIVLALFFCGAPVALAGPWEPLQRSFVRVPAPSDNDLSVARFGTRAWRTAFSQNALIVTVATPHPFALPFSPAIETQEMGQYGTQPSEMLRVGPAWFLAYYHGEFGGALWQFNANGSIGRQLFANPTYGLTYYHGEVLAETGSAAPFFFTPLRIHRLKYSQGAWQEVGHVDFEHNIVALTQIGGDLYAIAALGYQSAALVRIDLSGNMQQIWPFHGDLGVRNISRSPSGDFAIGTRGYVIRLHRQGSKWNAAWYAPRDCITYTSVARDRPFDAHCIASQGAKSYERHSLKPIGNVQVTSDGTWMLERFGQTLLHFNGARWVSVDLPTLAKNETLVQIQSLERDDLALLTSESLWVRRNAQWRRAGQKKTECQSPYFAISSGNAWCLAQMNGKNSILRIGFFGSNGTTLSPHGDAEIVAGGIYGDAWFSERDTAFIGHTTGQGTVEETPLSSPVLTISGGRDTVWFSETDNLHYGFIAPSNKVHELTWDTATIHSVAAAKTGAWLGETYRGTSIMIRQIDAAQTGSGGAYASDIRTWLVAPDGSLWAQSRSWPTVVHVTEEGGTMRYLLPCPDPHLRLLNAPDNGVWFLSLDPHCSGLIDESGIHVRNLPLVERVNYM